MSVANSILNELRAVGSKGLLIRELTARLKLDQEQIVMTIKQLISEGMIMQKNDVEGTKYVISEAMTGGVDHGKLSDLNGCPCFHCLKISRCGIRQPDSPLSCRKLEEWVVDSGLSAAN
ncbi:MAG: hypothetical protein HXY34_13080 [Candidatus Thorarchaeota archaeon]|nr:hypothetical protein [Candidatus Thorarchaeota archaeon]